MCHYKSLQFTLVRQRVLEILLAKHHAVEAYDILDELQDEGLGSQPPIACRALDFLVKNSFAHKIERLNAFVACNCPNQNHTPAFLICQTRTAVVEAHSEPLKGMLGRAAKAADFVIKRAVAKRAVVEAEGLCPNCRVGTSV